MSEIFRKRAKGGYPPFGYLFIKHSQRLKYYIPYLEAFQDHHKIPPIRFHELDPDIWPGGYVESIFEGFLVLNNLAEIARQLTNYPIPPPNQIITKVKEYLSLTKSEQQETSYLLIDKCKPWDGTRIKNILTNSFYAGIQPWYQYKSLGEWSGEWGLQNSHPKLISQELYQQVQEAVQNNKSYKF